MYLASCQTGVTAMADKEITNKVQGPFYIDLRPAAYAGVRKEFCEYCEGIVFYGNNDNLCITIIWNGRFED
jgi:hypothetical protein